LTGITISLTIHDCMIWSWYLCYINYILERGSPRQGPTELLN